MAKYKIIPSSRTIVQSPISIGHKAEKGVKSIEFDLTAWVETYGSGTLTVIMRRWGDAIPYPIALEIDENNKATWTLSDMDTAKAGMAYAQLSYIVGETVVKKSDIYTFRVMDSLTGEGEPPEAYESWLEHLQRLAAEAMAEVLDIEDIPTDKTLTIDGGVADAKTTGDAISAINESLDALRIEEAITGYTIEQGTINTTDGSDGSSLSTNRARTSFLHFNGIKMRVVPKEGYRISGRTYSSNSISSFVSSTDWTTEPIEYSDSSKYYRIVMAKIDGSNIPVDSLPSDVITVTSYKNTDVTLTIDGKSADAGAVGRKIDSIESDLSIFEIAETITDYTISQGTINTTDGSDGSSLSTNRARTSFLHFNGIKMRVVPKEGYRISGRTYADNSIDSFVSSTDWTTEPIEYSDSSKYYRIVMAKVDGSNIPVESLPSDVITVTYYDKTDKNLTLDGRCADAGAVGRKICVLEDEQRGVVGRNNRIETVALLQQLNRKTRISGSTYGKAPLCFIHFSDIHGDAACLANVVEFKNAYSSYIKDILHTGDTVRYSYPDGMAFWNGVSGAENILNVIGNHDTKASQSGAWTGLSMADAYATYFAPYISNWGCTYTADKTYYYKDYTAEGVRLIVLDIMHQTAEQLSWFTSTLTSARTAELDVVVAIHCRPHWLFENNASVWDDKVNVPEYSRGYSDTSTPTEGYFPSNLADDYADAADAHIDAGGNFICWLHGHTHFRILAHLQTHNRQLDVSVANAGRPGYAQNYVWERITDTKSMDDFNVVGIDTYGKILRIAKFGVNADRLMRVAHTMSYNYQTHTIIHAN